MQLIYKLKKEKKMHAMQYEYDSTFYFYVLKKKNRHY